MFKQNKTLIKLNVILMTVLCCIALVSCAQQKDESAAVVNKIATLPNFTITKVPDSTAFTNKQLQTNKPVVIMFFSPDCDHCQKETKELLEYKNKIDNLQIVMLSNAKFSDLKKFYADYNISTMPNIVMGKDDDYKVGMKFSPKQYPAIYVYDNKYNLAKAYIGNISIDAIVKAAE